MMTEGNLHFENVSGNVTIQQAGSNIIAGNQAALQAALRQRAAQPMAAMPYKFLASYDISDRDIFFGRETVIENLLGKIPRCKTLLINGRSGAGKTSLLHAGLIPRLAENGYVYLSFRDYSDPLRQLRDYVAQDDLFKPYAEQARSLPLLLKSIVRPHGFDAAQRPPQPVVVIFDQFERFFVNVPPPLRAQFIQQIKACLDSELNSAELNLVFALREDFFGALLIEFEELIPDFLNQAARVNLLPLRREEARDAILLPLKHTPVRVGYHLDFVDDVLLPGLIGESAGGERIDPPHVQIVCNQLYQAARERCAAELKQGGLAQIDRTLYEELGETRGMLRSYLDEVLDRAAQREPERRDVLRSMLKVMVESTGTRRFVALPDLCRGLPDVPAAQLEQHVRQLQHSRILETRVQDAAVQYSLSHEVLVEKVQSWFDERALQRKKAQETLERGLAEWQSSGAVFNAQQVAHIRQWLPAEQLDARTEELLRASQQAHDERQREKAEQARRMRSIKRIVWSVVTLAFVVAVGLTTWALRERNIAEQQARVALIRSLVAYALQDNAQEKRERAALIARHAYLLNQRYKGNEQAQIEDALHTIFRTEAIIEEPYSPDLAQQVCQKVRFKKALTSEEWEQLVGTEIVYKPACPELKSIDPLLSLRSEKMIAIDYMALLLNISDTDGWKRPIQYIGNHNRFKNKEKVNSDEATGLMWQKSGSIDPMTYAKAQKYVENLNNEGFAGYTDWRLPTVEELLSLFEPQEQSQDLYINPVFDVKQSWVWSADICQIQNGGSSGSAWSVSFDRGSVYWLNLDTDLYVRVVRSRQ